MDDSGWLSTRNKKKVPKPQHRIKKMRSSNLKPVKSTCIRITNSPPPKQLFTATKQSSLNDFFSTHEDPQMEVEVNFDHDSQAGKLEQNSQGNSNINLSDTNVVTKCSGMSEKNDENKLRSETLHGDCRNKDGSLEDEATITSDINLFAERDKETKGNHYFVDHVNIVSRSNKGNNISTRENNDENIIAAKINAGNLNKRRSVKRMHFSGESDVSLDNPEKRTRLDVTLPENDLKLSKDCAVTYNYLVNDKNKKSDRTIPHAVKDNTVQPQSVDADLGFDSEYGINTEGINVPVSCFSSQSLDLGSQLSLKSQELEFESVNTLNFDTQYDNLSLELNNESLSALRSLKGESLTFSSQTEDTDTICNLVDADTINVDLSLSTDCQSETFNRKYDASLDLSSQNDSVDIGAKTCDVTDSQELLHDDSQLSLTSSPSGSVFEYQSLDFS
ncbi:uncharacterized protein LOC123554865 [Mercenaria mercenaria]|uniref:uncharacterized protein LOC123554865 n=1 Tax=Mercenaria mercenaria TaxID=6596 RepID=UPI00234F4627|nr:uncharacterized protein LOC123554865 [Mercenaria mercenaria]